MQACDDSPRGGELVDTEPLEQLAPEDQQRLQGREGGAQGGLGDRPLQRQRGEHLAELSVVERARPVRVKDREELVGLFGSHPEPAGDQPEDLPPLGSREDRVLPSRHEDTPCRLQPRLRPVQHPEHDRARLHRCVARRGHLTGHA